MAATFKVGVRNQRAAATLRLNQRSTNRDSGLLQLLHTVGSFSLLIGFASQLVVLYGAWRTGDKPQMIQAALLLLALGSDALALVLRPSLPPQLVPDLLGCLAGLLLFSPAVNAVRKMLAAQPDGK